jgi:hypothetical protein
MNKSDSIVNLAKALVLAQGEMGNAVKGATNPFFNKSYAGLNSIREACMPQLNKYGIVVLQPTVELNGDLYVETILLHQSGEYLSGLTAVRTEKLNNPQAMGAGISYSRRYGLQSILSIGAEDDDGEGAMARTPQTTVTTAEIKQSKGECKHIWKDDKFKKGWSWCPNCDYKKDPNGVVGLKK